MNSICGCCWNKKCKFGEWHYSLPLVEIDVEASKCLLTISMHNACVTWLYEVNSRKMNVFYIGGHECYDEL